MTTARNWRVRSTEEAAAKAAAEAEVEALAQQNRTIEAWQAFFAEHGIQGPPGEPGANGTNGIDGKDGIDGTNGIDGKDGVWVVKTTVLYESDAPLARVTAAIDELSDGTVRTRTLKRDAMGRPHEMS